MLVLTRKQQEKIRIGDQIVITVLKTKGKSVRLGIEAPAEVSVVRGELSIEGQAIDWQPESQDGAEEPARPAAAAPSDRRACLWPTPSQTDAARISFQRVPREQLNRASAPSQNGGPLRAMMAGRSVST